MSNSTFDGRDAVPFGQLRDDDEQPLDEDLDDEALDSADADERAAREGTKGDDDIRV